jgi:hypothetical protein
MLFPCYNLEKCLLVCEKMVSTSYYTPPVSIVKKCYEFPFKFCVVITIFLLSMKNVCKTPMYSQLPHKSRYHLNGLHLIEVENIRAGCVHQVVVRFTFPITRGRLKAITMPTPQNINRAPYKRRMKSRFFICCLFFRNETFP